MFFFSFCSVIKMWDTGFATHWKKKYFPSNEECRSDVPPKKVAKGFTLQQLSFSLVFLSIGLAISCAVFLFEILLKA